MHIYVQESRINTEDLLFPQKEHTASPGLCQHINPPPQKIRGKTHKKRSAPHEHLPIRNRKHRRPPHRNPRQLRGSVPLPPGPPSPGAPRPQGAERPGKHTHGNRRKDKDRAHGHAAFERQGAGLFTGREFL